MTDVSTTCAVVIFRDVLLQLMVLNSGYRLLTRKVLLATVDKYPVRCNKDSTFIQSGVFRFHECGHKRGNCITVAVSWMIGFLM